MLKQLMSSFLQNLRALPGPFWVLAGATFVNRFGVFVWPFLTIIITRNGNTAAQAGWAVGAYSVGGFLAAALGGWLADRMGRNVTMALSALCGAVCMMAMSQATDWQALAVIAFLTGLVSEAGQPASNALVQDIVPQEHRVLAYAVQRFAVNLGWSFGPAVAGFLADYSFFWLFAVDAVTSAFFGIIAWMFLPRGRRTPVEMPVGARRGLPSGKTGLFSRCLPPAFASRGYSARQARLSLCISSDPACR